MISGQCRQLFDCQIVVDSDHIPRMDYPAVPKTYAAMSPVDRIVFAWTQAVIEYERASLRHSAPQRVLVHLARCLCAVPAEYFDIIADFLDKPGRQLILVSDVPPGNLKNFSPRLVSRFGSGVCREIYPPSSETRAAITLNKCRELNITLPESVVDYIAENIRSSVREIEGAIKTLASHLQVYGEITYDQAVNNLKNLVNVKSQITTLEAIKERVAKEFDLPKVEVLDSAARKKPIPTARAMAMCLASELIPALSLNDIGRSFNKDHSSVHEAIKKLRAKLLDENEKELAAIYQNLTTSLKKD